MLNRHPQIDMANVYGVEVPGAEGRAGMVAFSLEDEGKFDLSAFTQLVDEQLPVYARPVFIRVQRAMATTGTFKLLKGELREQAFDPERVDGDEIYVRMPRSKEYVCLNTGLYQKIATSDAGF